MGILKSNLSDFFGLDIGTTAIRLVELRSTGATKSLVKYASVQLEANLGQSDSKADLAKLAEVIATLIGQARPTTKNVAVGLPANKVFTTVADIDRLPGDEMSKAIQYQADSLIPTSLAESKLDWAVLGDSPTDKTKQEILLSSVPNDYVETRLDMLDSIGLNVIAFEPDSLALTRALMTPNAADAELLIDIGWKSTDLIIVLGGSPRLIRSISTGVQALVKSASQSLNIDEKQAEQFVMKFGLSRDKLEGQIFQSVSGSVDILVSEFEKSIKFFQTRYPDTKLEKLIVTGGASVVPEFPLFLANKFGLNVEIGNAWRNVAFPRDRQNELLAISNQFGVAVGLAEREA